MRLLIKRFWSRKGDLSAAGLDIKRAMGGPESVQSKGSDLRCFRWMDISFLSALKLRPLALDKNELSE